MLIDTLFFGVFFMLLLFSIKRERKENPAIGISLNQTNFIKGLAALIVLFHHLAQSVGGKLFCYMGYASVAVFFFVSGYGIMYCHLTRDKYVNTLVKKKIPRLLRWCLFTLLLNILYWCIEGGLYSISAKEIIFSFYGNRMLNWFMPFLIIHYFMFAVSVKLFSKNINTLIWMLFVLTGVYCGICLVLGVHVSRYYSSICFPIGVLFAGFSKSISGSSEKVFICNLVKKQDIAMLIPFFCFGVILLIAIALPDEAGIFIEVIRGICYILSSMLFVVGIILFSYNRRSGLLERIGKHSGEMILLQGIGLSIFRSQLIYINNAYIYILASCTVVALLMILVVPIYKRI